MKTKGQPISPLVARVALGVFLLVALAGAGTTVWRLANWATVNGANTVGEAGKVYFAARFAAGETIFVTGDQPPHYASMHGALLHATVGVIARVGGLHERGMYVAGRAISVMGTLIALGFAVAIMRKMGASTWACAGAVMLFFLPEAIVQHAVSYRPDHWNLALAAGACWLLVSGGGKGWRLIVLGLLPGVAFFIKAPGAGLMVSIGVGFWVMGERKRGIAAALLSGGVLGAALVGVAVGAGENFAGGLRSGMAMPMSVDYLASMVGEVKYAVIWALPMVGVIFSSRMRDENMEDCAKPQAADARGGTFRGRGRGREPGVVWVFLGVSFLTAAVSALRAGGGPYYFVEATLWAAVLGATWVDRVLRRSPDSREPGLWAAAVWLLICAAVWVTPVWETAKESYPITDQTQRMDTSVRISRRVGADRARMAEVINREGWYTYSDDASLNILLDKPAVIYPLLGALQLQRGASAETLVGPVREQRYDAIVLSGIVSHYMGVANLPPAFVEAVLRYYEPVDVGTRYVVMLRRRGIQDSK